MSAVVLTSLIQKTWVCPAQNRDKTGKNALDSKTRPRTSKTDLEYYNTCCRCIFFFFFPFKELFKEFRSYFARIDSITWSRFSPFTLSLGLLKAILQDSVPELLRNVATQVFASPKIPIFYLMTFHPSVTLNIIIEIERMECEIINY